ncbi:MAG: NAD(+) kinase [Gammaproteobacteria bacterium]|nr:NAD(+) kinase [Gammaproteobacteria bacterium]
MRADIKTIGLFGKFGSRTSGDEITRLCEFLQSRKLNVLLDEATAKLVDKPARDSLPIADIGEHIDLAIVIGGDGTLLNVARNLADWEVPLIGVNLGRLGFLTDIPAENMLSDIGRMLDGDYETEQRFLLSARIQRQGEIVYSSNAFNDVIVNKSGLARLIEFETYLDGEFVNGMVADGIIIATPTGSTAYALSAGGPLLHPTLSAIVLVPICPHTLSDRPIVVSSDSVVEIVMTRTKDQRAHVTLDGQLNYPLQDEDRISIRRAQHAICLWHPSGRNHYDVLRAKLHWGGKF